MDVFLKWVISDFRGTDNYVDLITPAADTDAVAARLREFCLPRKRAEELSHARLLGFQLFCDGDSVGWTRRELDLSQPDKLTTRAAFGWCDRRVSHYPVCSWLRPQHSCLERMIGACGSGCRHFIY